MLKLDSSISHNAHVNELLAELRACDPVRNIHIEFKGILDGFITKHDDIDNATCVAQIRDKRPVEFLNSMENLRGSTTFWRIIRDYSLTEGIVCIKYL